MGQKIRESASDSACTIHQETTKFKAGTLPLTMYESAKQKGERLLFTTKPVNECESEEVNTAWTHKPILRANLRAVLKKKSE